MAGTESPPESGQLTTSATPDTELESVTVEAQRRRELIDKQVGEFVYSIVGPAKVESLARWNVPVCVAMAGLTAAEADFVKHRLSQIVTDAGVPLGGPDCGPNFVIVVTPEPEKLLKDWWAEEHRLFNRDRGLGGVNRFIQTDQPVRVWHNACNAPPGIAAYAFSKAERTYTAQEATAMTSRTEHWGPWHAVAKPVSEILRELAESMHSAGA